MPSLLGLAPGEACHAASVAKRAVRSYRTLSPLPAVSRVNSDKVRAVCFLWRYLGGRPRRVLPGTVFPWSPDFPHPAGFPHRQGAAIRPSGSLYIDVCALLVKPVHEEIRDIRGDGYGMRTFSEP